MSKLKDELKKAEDSLASAISANITLVEDNSDLKARDATLELESKGLETHAMNIKDSRKLNVEEVDRLKTSLALIEKNGDVEKEEKVRIEQKAYDDMYEVHAYGFNHFLCQVLFHCKVPDE